MRGFDLFPLFFTALAALPNCRRIPGNLLQNFSQFGKTTKIRLNRMTANSAQSMTKAGSVTAKMLMLFSVAFHFY
jgi:hypothetical protein